MAYVAPPTFTASAVLTAAQLTILGNDILYLKDRADNPARARVYHNTTQSLANGTDTALAFNGEGVDSATLHDTVTNNTRVTIPSGEGGWYLFTAFVAFAANATGQRKIAIREDGATVIAQLLIDAAAGTQDTRLTLATFWQPSAGNYYEVVASQNSGGALNVLSDMQFNVQRTA